MQSLYIISHVRLVCAAVLCLLPFTVCAGDDSPAVYVQADTPDEGNGNEATAMEAKMRITIAGTVFTATLENNATTKALMEILPLTLQMSELNGNEKYHYLPSPLPTEASNPGTIHSGDIMLFGSSCLVVFYQTFSTNYSYTRIGRIDNVSSLAAAVGNSNVSITFEMDSSTGIAGAKIMTNTDGNEQRYNINGIRVNKKYKGIYIKNGKKYR